jgi:hypothetical protein
MKMTKSIIAIVAAVSATGFIACNNPGTPVMSHKLIATSGQTSIPLYPDEHSLVEVSHRSQQGGVTGAVGDIQKDMTAKQIDDQTPVKVLATDDNGAQVEIIDGPMKGQMGFVTKQNVD